MCTISNSWEERLTSCLLNCLKVNLGVFRWRKRFACVGGFFFPLNCSFLCNSTRNGIIWACQTHLWKADVLVHQWSSLSWWAMNTENGRSSCSNIKLLLQAFQAGFLSSPQEMTDNPFFFFLFPRQGMHWGRNTVCNIKIITYPEVR